MILWDGKFLFCDFLSVICRTNCSSAQDSPVIVTALHMISDTGLIRDRRTASYVAITMISISDAYESIFVLLNLSISWLMSSTIGRVESMATGPEGKSQGSSSQPLLSAKRITSTRFRKPSFIIARALYVSTDFTPICNALAMDLLL